MDGHSPIPKGKPLWMANRYNVMATIKMAGFLHFRKLFSGGSKFDRTTYKQI
jgi:tryptophan 2,3-dioxygenase